ncbi:hypothetical protein LINPERHAP1_LOCUS30064 [Linum perenne]
MRFTYVVVGWEGSAHDARILTSTATYRNSQFPMPPLGMVAIVILPRRLSLYMINSYLVFLGIIREILRCGFWICKRTWVSSTISRVYFSFLGDTTLGGPNGHEELFNYSILVFAM